VKVRAVTALERGPPWFAAGRGGTTARRACKLVIFTLHESYKVKRIQRNPKVQVARCDVRGNLSGPWLNATCRVILDHPSQERRAYAALTAKYGWQMRIGDFFSALTRRKSQRVVMEIALSAS
jgi:PPOX class probable F420-dependent enzyme